MAETYFTDDSMIRRIHREQVVALSGPRSLLMQAAHPVAFAGFFDTTGDLDEPYERLRRTAQVLDTITFGEKADADRQTARVRRIHARVNGALAYDAGRFPAGTPWRADDPQLLLWILATLADSAILVYERYVGPLDRAARDAYWQDMQVLGRLFGIPDERLPPTSVDFERYMHEMLHGDTLHVSPRARELGIQIVLRPPVPLPARPLLELANFITVGLLPARIRRQYRLGWDPVRALTLRVGAEYAKRLLLPTLPSRIRYATR